MNNDFNKKEDLTLFFCDIYGTIDGGLTEEECIVFAELLEKIRVKNNSDYLYFGMSSTEHPDVVDMYESRLSRYFKDRIVLIPKDVESEVLREIKISYPSLFAFLPPNGIETPTNPLTVLEFFPKNI